MIQLIAFDLDGTLTQHKTKLSEKHRGILTQLSEKYRLVMVGAGQSRRIFTQMERFPVDIIGNYGMQYSKYNAATGDLDAVFDRVVDCDRSLCEKRIDVLREKFGFTKYAGDSVEFHVSGCVTFPILGTAAVLADKLAFDPDRKKRRAIYAEVMAMFPEYNVFVGGSSSFDMAPKPYNKYHALADYCAEHGIAHDETVFFGDDYGPGGNDESVYNSDFGFVKVDNYLDFPALAGNLL